MKTKHIFLSVLIASSGFAFTACDDYLDEMCIRDRDTPKDAVLQITYIGYVSQEVKVSGKKELNVVLKEDTETLDEVVVVGFGTQKKVNLTGAVGLATAKELESRPVTSATQALQGLVPGLQISTSTGELDKTADISIRGTGTIGEGSSG